jgi:ribosomal protein L40E
MGLGRLLTLPATTMPSNRPNLILDEQAFQDLLSAAFTIQEHNARLNQVRQTEKKPLIRSQAEPDSFCHHCGAVKPPEESRCQHCGLDEFRPGERMQRKWASMWLMSQEQSLWPERPAAVRETLQEAGAGSQEIHEELREKGPASEAKQPQVGSTGDPVVESLLAVPLAHDPWANDALANGMAGKTRVTAQSEAAAMEDLRCRSANNTSAGNTVGNTALDNKGSREDAPFQSEWSWGPNSPSESAKEVWAPEHSDLDTETFSLQASDNSSPTGSTAKGTTGGTISHGRTLDGTAFEAATGEETMGEETSADPAIGNTDLMDARMFDSGSESYQSSDITSADVTSGHPSSSASLGRRLADLRVTLRFHRANLYLGAAIFLAALALMWPTVSAPQRASLSPMERALVAIGVAEGPAPVIHSTGDPGINVWVDPHTALYYCPGEEEYGKTADGRVSSQHDAQIDRFQPAGRAPCE